MNRFVPQINTQHVKNSFWPVLETVIPPLLMLVSVPVFIRFLGAEKYGIWILVNSVAAFVGFLNVGFGDVNVKYISKYLALGDREKVRDVVHAIYSLSVFALTGGILLGGAVSSFTVLLGEYYSWAQKLSEYSSLIAMGFAIFSLKVVEQSFLAVFKGFERYDLASKLGVISRALPIVANVFIAYFTQSLFIIFLSSIVISASFLVLNYYIIRSGFIKFTPLPGINRSVLCEIMGFGLWSFAQGLIGILATQTDKLLVAKLAGVKVLAYYTIAQMVGGQIHAVFSSASAFIFPIIAKKVELKESLTPVYYKMQLFVVVAGLATVLAVFYSRDFIFLTWLGYEGYSNIIMLAEIFLLLELFVLPTIVAYYYLNAAGFIHVNTLLMVISLLLQVILMIVSFNYGGVFGLAVGKAAAVLVVSVVSVVFVYHKILKMRNSVGHLSLTFAPGALVLALYYWFSF